MVQTRKQINKMYRDWRRAHGNQKPNRVIVRIIWEDDYYEGDDTTSVATMGLKPDPWFTNPDADDPNLVWYAGTLDDLWEMRKLGNGSDFVVVKVLEFWKKK